MKKLTILLSLLFCFVVVVDADAKPKKSVKKRARTTRVVKKKRIIPPTIHENPYLLCEDTCAHVHGIDMSHYQGEVFWETVCQHSKMSYVYLKATEGGDRIDSQYERNIDLAHRHGLKVGSYHFFRPTVDLYSQLKNFTAQCLPGEQDLIPMLDVETTGKLSDSEFCDSLHKFLDMLEGTYNQKPLVYTYRNFYNEHLVGQLAEYHLMVAMYADEPPVLADKRDYIIWQYTCKGRIQGVSGMVDKSCLIGGHTVNDFRFIH
jgi:lysozyme